MTNSIQRNELIEQFSETNHRIISAENKIEAVQQTVRETHNDALETMQDDIGNLIASQEAIHEEIKKQSHIVERGLAELGAIFNWGIAEIVHQFELQRQELRDIIKILEAPLETQARELRSRAEDAYRNGWIDDALQDFLEAEKKNYPDFTIHQSIGNIYLFEKKDLVHALEYYEKAAKYALPRSKYHTAYALLHVGLVYHLQGKEKEAYLTVKRSIELQPDLTEAQYQYAQYAALLNKPDEVKVSLRKAILGDRDYCLKASVDDNFIKMRDLVITLLKELQRQTAQKAKLSIKECKMELEFAGDVGNISFNHVAFDSFKQKIMDIENVFSRDSYFDILKAEEEAQKVKQKINGQNTKVLNDRIQECQSSINKTNSMLKEAELRKHTDVWLNRDTDFTGCLLVWLFFPITIPWSIIVNNRINKEISEINQSLSREESHLIELQKIEKKIAASAKKQA